MDSQQTISFNFRIGKATVCNIIQETCEAVCDVLKPVYLKSPSSPSEWKEIATEFERRWNFPNCLGTIDGKHVVMQAPALSGSKFFNYKGQFSIVLLAVCDANYFIILLDIGDSFRHSVGGVLANSKFEKALLENELPHPPADMISDSGSTLPYCFVGDAMFPLKNNLMRPSPGHKLPEDEAVFNYMLSSARRGIESTFGILVTHWRIFKRPIFAKVEKAVLLTQTACCLHNYLQQQSDWRSLSNLADREVDEDLLPGSWRRDMPGTNLMPIGQTSSNNYGGQALGVRDKF